MGVSNRFACGVVSFPGPLVLRANYIRLRPSVGGTPKIHDVTIPRYYTVS